MDLDVCHAAALLDIALDEVQVMLRGLHSLTALFNISKVHSLSFLHSSMVDFLEDPSRSQEFFIGKEDYKITESTMYFQVP